MSVKKQGSGTSSTPTVNVNPRAPFLEPVLPNLDDFASLYPKYPHCIVATYQIYRDLHIKRDLNETEVIDGMPFGRNEYFIKGVSRDPPNKTIIMVPFHLDAEIDLNWLQSVTKNWEVENYLVQVVIHTAETVIYQTCSAELPPLGD